MLHRAKITGFIAVIIGSIITGVYSLPLNAQTKLESSFLEDIETGENLEWTFSSEDESSSLNDEIQQLGEYNISESDPADVELTEENRKWGNGGDVEDYSVEVEVYDY